MNQENGIRLIDQLELDRILGRDQFIELLASVQNDATGTLLAELNRRARALTLDHFGNKIYTRGLIEVTNYCRNDCYYCGIRRSNRKAARYRLSLSQIMECCQVGYDLGFRTFVLQGGEDPTWTDDHIVSVVKAIKERWPDCAITLSLGEKPYESYRKYREAGADRYLLRHETADLAHYQRLHPENLSGVERQRCLDDLKRAGFQVGTGFMVGSPEQTLENLADDLLLTQRLSPEMIGIGPFLPHHDTPFGEQAPGDMNLTLALISILRLMLPDSLIPSTTALGTIHPDGREKGILAGANVVMPNLSPQEFRDKYLLYDNKISTGEEAAESRAALEKRMEKIGYQLSEDRGDHVKFQKVDHVYGKEGSAVNYDPSSKMAAEFINHQEILDTLDFARANKSNRELISSLIDRARDCKGLTHREATVLLECDLEEENEKIETLAREIKRRNYGNRIVMFAPLYLSNYCVNGCVYCPYHEKNKTISRKKLSQEDIKREVIALQDMGHKRLALEAGEDPVNNPIDYILDSIKTIYSIKHENGEIRRVNVNIAATTVDNYRKLKDAGIGTYILFQETYHQPSYEELHPTGPKHNYAYHTEAMDRAMEAGIDDVGIGVLFGLNRYRYDFVGMLMHGEHLEAVWGVGPHTISVPRICPADDVNPDQFSDAISDQVFSKIVAVLRIAVPYTGMIVSTRESQATRERVLALGVTQISGGSRTSVGGYDHPEEETDNSAQFDISDTRTLDQIVGWLLDLGYVPSFCTACYREGRTGDRFMQLVKSGQIANVCQANSLMTLKEYLEDYASPDVKRAGETVIEQEIDRIPNPKVKDIAASNLEKILQGSRDFRF